MGTKIFKQVANVLSVLLLVFSLHLSALAQNNGQPSGSGLQISPTRHEVVVEPGSQKTVIITIKNITSGDIVAKPTTNDFEADNETGEPKINVDPDAESPASIKNFVGTLPETTLAKGESKVINVAIDVPASATPGAYYGIIRFQAVPADTSADPGNVSLTASVGTIILVQVPGNLTESMQLVSLSAETANKQSGKFFISAPKVLALKVKNSGNSFLKPFGRITITNTFSSKEIYSYEINNTEPRGNVLPNNTRVFRNEVQNVTSFGRYTAVANIAYVQGGEVLTIKTTFWVIPLWVIVLLVLIIALLVGLILFIRMKFNKRRRARP